MRRSAAYWSLVVTILSVFLAGVPSAFADEKATESRRTISVSSQGEVTASPDLVILTVAVETTAPNASTAVSENAKRTAAVIKAVKALISGDDKVTTSRYSLETALSIDQAG